MAHLGMGEAGVVLGRAKAHALFDTEITRIATAHPREIAFQGVDSVTVAAQAAEIVGAEGGRRLLLREHHNLQWVADGAFYLAADQADWPAFRRQQELIARKPLHTFDAGIFAGEKLVMLDCLVGAKRDPFGITL